MNFFPSKYRIAGLVLVAVWCSGCKNEKPAVTEEQYNATRRHLVEVNKMMVRKDRQIIKGYAERHGLDMLESGTGLWYKIYTKGSGESAAEGKSATIKYKISLLDGTLCYDSDTEGEKTFTIGRGGVVSGLEEGILLLNAGGKAKFIMPPHLAYGLPGDGNKIPKRAIIVYDVEVMSIN